MRKKTDDGSVWKSGQTPGGKRYVAYRGSKTGLMQAKTTNVVEGKDKQGMLKVSTKSTDYKTGVTKKGKQLRHPVTGKTVKPKK